MIECGQECILHGIYDNVPWAKWWDTQTHDILPNKDYVAESI